MESDRLFMRRALALARRGAGWVSPNPMVGAVVVREGRVVGEGFHARAGLPHAEAEALRAAGEESRGATLYLNLEPCAHWGRTPPCVEAIVRAGIARVVVAVRDPNPLVSGRGIRYLRERGIEVVEGVMEEEARRANEAFFKFVTRRLPFVTWKYAVTLDGKVATRSGCSRWLSGEKARRWVHLLRSRTDAVLVGRGTVEADDPLLTSRLPRVHQPLRVVADSRLRLSPSARLFTVRAPLLLATTHLSPPEKRETFASLGAEVAILPEREGRVDVRALMELLARKEVTSVLLESGPTLAASLLEEGLIDKLYCVLTPKLLGGAGAPTPLGGAGRSRPEEAWKVKDLSLRRLGEDVLVEGYLDYSTGEGTGPES